MFTNEIIQYCEKKNWLLDSYSEFDSQIIQTSPQICRIKLDEMNNDKTKYFIQTKDGFEGWIWIKNYKGEV